MLMAALKRDDTDVLLPAFLARLDKILSDPTSYPLFDERVAGIVAERASADLVEVHPVAAQRGKQVSMAAHFMEQLPAFPLASMAEVLDIRKNLANPLVRFRGAIIEIERGLTSSSFDQSFAVEVESIYLEKVAPALLEIDEQIGANPYLRELLGAAVDKTGALLAAFLAIGFATKTGMQDVVAAAIEAAFPLTGIAAKGSWSYAEKRRAASRARCSSSTGRTRS